MAQFNFQFGGVVPDRVAAMGPEDWADIKDGDFNPLAELADWKTMQMSAQIQKAFKKEMAVWMQMAVAIVVAWIASEIAEFSDLIYTETSSKIQINLMKLAGAVVIYKIIELITKIQILLEFTTHHTFKILVSLTLKGGNVIKMFFNLWQKMIYMEYRMDQGGGVRLCFLFFLV